MHEIDKFEWFSHSNGNGSVLSQFVIKSSHFVITIAFCNKTVAFCNKKPDAFCNKLLSHFVMK